MGFYYGGKFLKPRFVYGVDVIMYIFKRRRFALILCFLFLSFSVYFASNKNNINENRSYDITQVSSIPVTEKVIIIDAGHGGEDRWCYWR